MARAPILAHRSDEAERMDTECANYEDYSRCLRDLSRVNVVTFTHRPMLAWLARHAAGPAAPEAEGAMQGPAPSAAEHPTPTAAEHPAPSAAVGSPDSCEAFSVLDVACGHGDALRQIRRRHPGARLEGIDLNPWSARAAREATDPANRITFHTGDAFAYTPARPFDFIISSQFTHHLTDDQVVDFLRWLRANAARGWFISDLHRHLVPYYGFPLLARLAGWHRFVRQDGQVSIARAFVRAEWPNLLARAGITGSQATVTWHLPFRLCVASR